MKTIDGLKNGKVAIVLTLASLFVGITPAFIHGYKIKGIMDTLELFLSELCLQLLL
jgi:hypothetical protein